MQDRQAVLGGEDAAYSLSLGFTIRRTLLDLRRAVFLTGTSMSAASRDRSEKGVLPAWKQALSCVEDRAKVAKYVIAACVVLVLFNLAKGGIVSTLRTGRRDAGVVKFAAIVHRHGARSGLWKFGFENDVVDWDVRLGALTPKGMEQAFSLGQKLRKIYWPDLTQGAPPMTSTPISIFSTHIDRTVDTAHGVLLGLFSDNGVEPNLEVGNCECRPEKGLKSSMKCAAACMGIQTVPNGIPKVQSSQRPLLLQFEECEGWLDQVARLKNSSQFLNAPQTLFKRELDMIEDVVGGNEVCLISDVDGTTLREEIDPPECSKIDLKWMERVWNNAVCVKTEGMEYPSDKRYKGEFVPKLTEVATWIWHQEYSVDRGPLAAGMLLDEIMERMQAHLPQPSTESKTQDFMVLYSAHDSTVAALLSVLGVVNWHFPDFVSRVVLELRAHESGDVNLFYVNLNYDGVPVEIPGCGMDCSWNDFVNTLGPRRRKIETCVKSKTRKSA
ncbi:hypothetical protein BSKO_12161 [Bryopsis sp. KO-2023]|nr:hypothetical protein BSKO_12161 [Bryopsis sp. KO-2023]